MRTAFWANLLFLILTSCAVANNPIALPSGGSLRASAKGAKTVFELRSAQGARASVQVERDGTVAPKSAPREVRIVGEVKPSVVVLVDSYPSVPGGMSYCQAGEERFLRVLSFADGKPEETFRLKVESCRDNLELASPGIEWRPESSTLAIHWLLGPTTKGKPEERTIRLSPEGKP
jgi:hypothetical protein